MLNVLYVGQSFADEDWCDKRKAQERYLDDCLSRYSNLHLSEDEKSFVQNLIMMIVVYMDYVLIKEEYNSKIFARLIYNGVPEENDSLLLCFVRDAMQNQDDSLLDHEKSELLYYYETVKKYYSKENYLVALHALQVDCILNSNCKCAVSNYLNYAVLRLNTLVKFPSLEMLAGDIQYSKPVYPEFSQRYERLLRENKNQQLDQEYIEYTKEKYQSLPQCVRDKISQYDFDIGFSDEIIGEKWEQKKQASTHIGKTRIRVWFERNKTIIDLSFLHEIGHVVDYIFDKDGFYSRNNKEWESAYNKEKELYLQTKLSCIDGLKDFHEYGVSNSTEYFASAFSDFVQNPKWLEKAVPNTFVCISALLNEGKM